jgi:hypothetical protein
MHLYPQGVESTRFSSPSLSSSTQLESGTIFGWSEQYENGEWVKMNTGVFPLKIIEVTGKKITSTLAGYELRP